MLEEKQRKALIKCFKKVKKIVISDLLSKFEEYATVEEIKNLGMTLNQYLLFRRFERTDFNKISDTNLIMLCGMTDFCIPAGDYKYPKDLIIAINELNDKIFELKK